MGYGVCGLEGRGILASCSGGADGEIYIYSDSHLDRRVQVSGRGELLGGILGRKLWLETGDPKACLHFLDGPRRWATHLLSAIYIEHTTSLDRPAKWQHRYLAFYGQPVSQIYR
jgi:hypothetical protein